MLKSEQLKFFIKKTSHSIVDGRYHFLSNQTASKVLQNIEKKKGKLNSNLKNQADIYAREILGWKGFSPWLYVYSAISNTFREGWIPDNYYGKMVIPKIQGNYGKISSLKPLCNKILNDYVSPELVSYINGFWFDKNLKPINRSDIEKLVFSESSKVVCKLDQSYQGKDVFLFNCQNFDIDFIEKKGNSIIQNFIQQHQFFNNFTTSSVATIRMTTVVDQMNKISLRACYLRLGRKYDTHVKSSSHIRIPINLYDGSLQEEGYLTDWRTICKHPDSLVGFSGKNVPQYDKCVRLVLKLHENFLMVRCIGWDIIVDNKNKPVLMEWNGYSNDIKFSEATQGPCFKDLNWHLLKKH